MPAINVTDSSFSPVRIYAFRFVISFADVLLGFTAVVSEYTALGMPMPAMKMYDFLINFLKFLTNVLFEHLSLANFAEA